MGGGETVTRTLANEMVKRGHEVCVIYLWDRTNGIEELVDRRVKTIRIDGMTNIRDGAIKGTELRFLEKRLRQTLMLIIPDIVINQWMPSSTVDRAMRCLDSALIKCHHGVIKHTPQIKRLRQKVFYTVFGKKAGWIRMYPELKKDYIHSDTWVLLSHATKRDAKYLIKWAEEDRLKVIPNPLPYSVNENNINIDKKKKEVIFVGRVIELKRVWYLLEAWKMIEDKVPDWKFRVVGDGAFLENEKKHAEELSIKNIVFEGFKEAKPYMQEASVLMMASSQEGFCMVIAEAQQCGCVPVVTDSFPAVHDLIQDGRNGVLTSDNDIKEFAEAVYHLICHEEQRKKLAKAAMVDSQRFSVASICDQWESLFKTVKICRKYGSQI